MQAYGQGWPPQIEEAEIRVNILDQDDNPPKMAEQMVNLTIAENATVGQILIRLKCADPDEVGINLKVDKND
jgi:hypothetical protein